MNKEIVQTTVIPEGYEIDKEKSTFEKIIFKLKTPEYPTSFIGMIQLISGYYTDSNSTVCRAYDKLYSNEYNKNVYPTEEYAKASLALAQLLQLRKEYLRIAGYEHYTNIFSSNTRTHWGISYTKKGLEIVTWQFNNKVLSFPNKELAIIFFENFKDNLLEEAKILL